MQSAGWYVSPYHGNGALMLPILASFALDKEWLGFSAWAAKGATGCGGRGSSKNDDKGQ